MASTDSAILHYERNADSVTLQNLLRATYQQILERQPYQQERRGELAKLEGEFLRGKVGLRRLVRQIGHSHLYQQLFFNAGCNTRCVEQAFKHFLGRAPSHKAEVAGYHSILVKEGLKAMVDAFVDSEEYRLVFGNNTVPHPRSSFTSLSPMAYLLSHEINHSHQLAMQQSPLLQSLVALGSR
ncbi:MAG: phycobilisome rod-core linker polypeptide [Cyanobacteriota bacterium]|nr:phycobilisome rod-core linker polypeptide [Cyanobacteriota bacterium]